MTELQRAIQSAINRASAENASNTPDFILAEYLTDCLAAYDKAFAAREKWYGRPVPKLEPIPCESKKGHDILEGLNPHWIERDC